jgi:type II secretory pathway pseudopilin PulG
MQRRLFTLIEIIISLGIIATILALTYSFMSQGARISAKNSETARSLRLEHNLFKTIYSDIQSLQQCDPSPIPSLLLKKDTVYSHSSSIKVLGYIPHYIADNKITTYLNQIHYAIDLLPEGEHFALYRRITPQMIPTEKKGEWEYLYGPITEFNVSLWNEDKKEWVDEFDSAQEKKMPSALRITLAFPGDEPEKEEKRVTRTYPLTSSMQFTKAKIADEENSSSSTPLLPGP